MCAASKGKRTATTEGFLGAGLRSAFRQNRGRSEADDASLIR
jgi:hypothetical protein